MAKFELGGEVYPVPEMNFIAVEMAWPFIEGATSTRDPMKGTSAALAIIAAAMMEGPDFDPARFGIKDRRPDAFDPLLMTARFPEEIHGDLVHFFKKKLKANEIAHVKNCMFEVLREAGMEGESVSGEVPAVPQEEASPSTVTAPNTLPNSSQPELKEAPGIA